MKIIILTALALGLTFNASAAMLILESQDGTEIRLEYDVVNSHSNKPSLSADNIKITVTGNFSYGDVLHVKALQDSHFMWGDNVNKKSQRTMLRCNEAGVCTGELPQSLNLVTYGYDMKHWLQVNIHGRFLVDPYRNHPTFRAILPLH